MVENQWGASDMPQSTAAKVVVRDRSTRPTADRPRSRAARAGSAPPSCWRDQELTSQPSSPQTAK